MLGVIVLSLCSCDFDIIISFNKIRFGSVWIYLIFLSAKRTWEGKKQNIEKMNNSMSQPTQQIILQVTVTNYFEEQMNGIMENSK